MNDIRKTLKERGGRYGNFADNARVAQDLKVIWDRSPGARAELDEPTISVIHEGMEMILHKVARICNGDPTYLDSWVDIVGYAQLVVDHLKGEECQATEDLEGTTLSGAQDVKRSGPLQKT